MNNGVNLKYTFYDTPCESTACGVLHTAALSCGGTPMGDESIRTAVRAWAEDRAAAEATYGHISTWETGGGDGHVEVVLRAAGLDGRRTVV